MANDSFKIKKSLNIEPLASGAGTAEGDIAYDLTTHKANIYNGTSASSVVTEAHSATLTNKTFDADGSGNSITNIENADIKASAAIARNKLATGTNNDVIINDGSGVMSGVAPGSANNVLKSNGTAWTSAAYTAPTVQRFTSGSGTYTTAAGCVRIKVSMSGGGGGGGGGGNSGQSDGGDGGDSTFGSSLLTSAKGLKGKINNDQGGSGGAATVNSPALTVFAFSGGDGGGGASNNASLVSVNGGAGGNNFLGGGGGRGPGSAAGHDGITNTGGGGAGGSTTTVASNNAGSGGGAGAYIEAIINSPGASYAYAVGAGGSAGGAGSNGAAGGAGAAGIIVVEEFYI